ncbi:MAG: hypothetical protein P4L46_07615 [Fimbriimonas sp.]|nr:hypothetical protein [Fimbriimonas sp.]
MVIVLLGNMSSFGPIVLPLAVVTVFVSGIWAWMESDKKRFLNKRFKSLWLGCQDRLARFEEVQKRMRKDQIAHLSEMPNTIRAVSKALYIALRRADIISHEVALSEKGLYSEPPSWKSPSRDAQSQELYRIADKNIAEYRAQFAGVMAGVQRTEAQSAVFMTTLDTLRMKMIGYRLVGRSPEMSSHDFLEALAEARAQLQSIDTALDELDLGHYPKTIAVVPPPIPEDVAQQLKNRGIGG